MKRTASCLCGDLRITAEGDPARVNMCSCMECQRRSGSAFQIGAFFSGQPDHLDRGRVHGLYPYRRVGERDRPAFLPDLRRVGLFQTRRTAVNRRHSRRLLCRPRFSGTEDRRMEQAQASLGRDPGWDGRVRRKPAVTKLVRFRACTGRRIARASRLRATSPSHPGAAAPTATGRAAGAHRR